MRKLIVFFDSAGHRVGAILMHLELAQKQSPRSSICAIIRNVETQNCEHAEDTSDMSSRDNKYSLNNVVSHPSGALEPTDSTKHYKPLKEIRLLTERRESVKI
uniref:Uncharacterized protein n=1 Tax=Glossina pallidipes TaxID=7398 RepID=A0A1A9Z6V1_GLOPL